MNVLSRYPVLHDSMDTRVRVSLPAPQKATFFRPFDVTEINRNSLVHSLLFQSTILIPVGAIESVLDLSYLCFLHFSSVLLRR